ncbi:NUDIX hydrolase [Nocardioides sp. Soil805]|uniref:NUDIX hydrolase n=1 Tax=Nocardioides sp. Soil805 TaxID=1736416 RepID=UPI000702601C|nr:NUDIX hydrolase [Nocardioides sp. Soil805]KRF30671.1 NUDIX hydrolase [Nocardioides sp. Soil805]
MSQPITVTTVAEGVARLVWSTDTTIDEVRREVARALVDHPRVETLVDPDDQAAQRTATWSGMHREGVMRGVTVEDGPVDRIVYARLATDASVNEPGGFRALLNSFLPRKRAISQVLVRDPDDRVLLCRLTYKQDWDLPGGVVEVGESPRLAAAREVEEELGLTLDLGPLLLTDWLPPWGGWDDAICLVFDGGVHDASVLDRVVKQEREIRDVRFCTPDEVRELAADFTTRRVEAALRGEGDYTESGR